MPRNTDALKQWNTHLKQFRKDNPSMSYKEAQKAARNTFYKKGNVPQPKARKPKKIKCRDDQVLNTNTNRCRKKCVPPKGVRNPNNNTCVSKLRGRRKPKIVPPVPKIVPSVPPVATIVPPKPQKQISVPTPAPSIAIGEDDPIKDISTSFNKTSDPLPLQPGELEQFEKTVRDIEDDDDDDEPYPDDPYEPDYNPDDPYAEIYDDNDNELYRGLYRGLIETLEMYKLLKNNLNKSGMSSDKLKLINHFDDGKFLNDIMNKKIEFSISELNSYYQALRKLFLSNANTYPALAKSIDYIEQRIISGLDACDDGYKRSYDTWECEKEETVIPDEIDELQKDINELDKKIDQLENELYEEDDQDEQDKIQKEIDELQKEINEDDKQIKQLEDELNEDDKYDDDKELSEVELPATIDKYDYDPDEGTEVSYKPNDEDDDYDKVEILDKPPLPRDTYEFYADSLKKDYIRYNQLMGGRKINMMEWLDEDEQREAEDALYGLDYFTSKYGSIEDVIDRIYRGDQSIPKQELMAFTMNVDIINDLLEDVVKKMKDQNVYVQDID